MIKQFSAGDIVTRPFKTFKHWQIQSKNAAGVDRSGQSTYIENLGEVNRGQKIETTFYESGSQKYNPLLEPMTQNGKYERNIFSLTNSMFYRNPTNPMEMFGLENIEIDPNSGKKEVRNIHDKIVTLRISKNYWGEKIVPNSVEIVDNSDFHNTYKIYDDGMTNLFITGSHFSNQVRLSAVSPMPPTPQWNTSSAQFYAVINGTTQSISLKQAKEFMNLGVAVSYTQDEADSWIYAESSSRNYYFPENERFGQSVSAWYKYIAVGSPMDNLSISDKKQGYASIFKYDDSTSQHRLIKKFLSPQSQDGLSIEFGHDNNLLLKLENNGFLGLEHSGSYLDSFGYSVSVRDNFLAIGAPTGSACFVSGSNNGFVYVYDRFKGGSDNWGVINIIQGGTEEDRFGNSVSIDNDILAIGAPGVSGSKGEVYIFRLKRFMDSTNPCRSIATASFFYQINQCGLPATDISGSALYTSVNTPSFASGNYSWEYEATLKPTAVQTGDKFGWVLEANNDRVIVGNRKTSGKGYATLFVCNYVSASIGGCPTASWSESSTFVGDNTIGDLNPSDVQFSIQSTLSHDGFGWSVAMDGLNMVIGSYYDVGFLPYNGASASLLNIMGAAYFYHKHNICSPPTESFYKTQKTFGDVSNITTNNFGRKVSVDGQRAVVSSVADKVIYTLSGSSYSFESSSYRSSGADDAVLGRVSMYQLNTDYTWTRVGEIRRNKESNQPFNLFGEGLSLSSDFLAVGAPIITENLSGASAELFYNQISASFLPSYSGSVFVYDLEEYENDPLIGNIFYKNGYVTVTHTSSNYKNILSATGSSGFDMSYQGTHTIYENEYLVSINPGEFNYSTNPSSLIQNSLLFDVNQDGVFDFADLDLIMRYLNKKRFYEDYVFDDNGIVTEQSNLLGNWVTNDVLLTEAGDVLLQESDYAAYLVSSSFNQFTKDAFDYIESNLDSTGILDIDGNGEINIKDGAILTAYFVNKLTPTSLAQWVDDDSTRRYTSEIEAYIGKYTGVQKFYTNPEFFGYQYSSSYDVTGSYLAPVITTIGLYDNNQLVAVAKLGRPVKNLIDWPINFIVRFDT